ncbi:MAG: DnaJ domain-containing protein, partial [Phormidesmis sp.]
MRNTTRTEANHYETLGIASSASQQQVKQAYRQLAKQFHPDSANSESTHDKIAAVNAAYEVLGDTQERRQYDAHR